jgi:hypothetical protein
MHLDSLRHNRYAFATKLTPAGSALVYSTSLLASIKGNSSVTFEHKETP